MKEKLLLMVLFWAVVSIQVLGHCDTKNGPVVSAAREALRTGNINYILIWVPKNDEAEVKKTFQRTLEIRKLNPALQKWADLYFFETVVRIHRLGEGEPYTGIKDSTVPEKTVMAVESALGRQAIEQILQLLETSLQKSVNDKFNDALLKKNYDPDDVEAGRDYIQHYVELLHYVENVYTVLNTARLYHAGSEMNAAGLFEKTDPAPVKQKMQITDRETDSLNKLTVFIIFGGLALIILIQLFFSHRKRNQKKISVASRYRHSLHHIRDRENSRINGN